MRPETVLATPTGWPGTFNNALMKRESNLPDTFWELITRTLWDKRNSALPYCPLFRRQGRPRKNWMVSSLELCWNKLHNSIFTNSAEQQAQLLTEARQRVFWIPISATLAVAIANIRYSCHYWHLSWSELFVTSFWLLFDLPKVGLKRVPDKSILFICLNHFK